ncbi:F-box domain, cyclin-like protein, partial [Metarhizium hybridum]
MSLPAEVYLKVLSNLRPLDLAVLSRCSRSQKQIVLPILYKTLSLQLWGGDPDGSSTLLLRTLSANPQLRYYIREVEVVNASSTLWTSGHSKLLGILLCSILTHPDRITSFRWKAGLLQTHIFFPGLVALECTQILNWTDVLWVRWHLLHCPSLKSLRLHLSKRISRHAGQWFLSQLSLRHAKDLCLQGADLSAMNIDVVDSLESLELKLCHGLDAFLARMISHGVPQSLKVLRIAGNITLKRLECFLSTVASRVQLEELSLRIGGVAETASTRFIRAIAPKVSNLVLDFRRDLCDPRTSVKYSIKDFQDMVSSLPMLTSVGVALDLRNPKYIRRYQRTKLEKGGFMEKSNLKSIHLRGHCVPLKRCIGDAKHLADPFAEISILLDHGSRLRKYNFKQKSYELTGVSDEERSQLSTDLYGIY